MNKLQRLNAILTIQSRRIVQLKIRIFGKRGAAFFNLLIGIASAYIAFNLPEDAIAPSVLFWVLILYAVIFMIDSAYILFRKEKQK